MMKAQVESSFGREYEQYAKYRQLFESGGIEIKSLPLKVLERFRELDEKAHHLEGPERAVELGRALIGKIPDFNFSVFVAADLFSDIGKVGDLNAESEVRDTCCAIYAIIDYEMPLTGLLQDFCDKHGIVLPDKFWSLPKISKDISRRAFYNLHVEWGDSVMAIAGLSEEVRRAAARHHAFEGYGAEKYVKENGDLIGPPLSNTELVVMLLDKYDAALTRRPNMTHDLAIIDVKLRLSHSRYTGDENILDLIDVIDKTFGEKKTASAKA